MSARRIGMLAAAAYLLVWGAAAHASDVEEVAPLGEAVERHLGTDGPMQQWVQDPDRLAEEEGDSIETREVLVDAFDTIKLSGLVPPIHFESGVANIPPSTIDSLADILDRMQDRLNVRLHLIGHADNQPLSPPLVAIYGDNFGLSRERAGQVAEHFQTALALPPEAVSYDWAGDTRPVASNQNEAGRALNRRVEVEVWYDEPREEVALEEFLVPHEISQVKVCRMETLCKLRYTDGHEQRARIQAPSREELNELLRKLGIGIRDLLRRGEPEYEQYNLGDSSLSDEIVFEIVGEHPKLIERPIIVRGERAVIGRPPERVLELLVD